MATIAAHATPRHDNRHPMSFVAYVLVVLVIPALGLLVNGLATGDTTWAVVGGISLIACLVGAGVIYSAMARRLQHSPLIPDASSEEKARYLANHPH
ncbi:hypothetical protein AAFP30_01230 [Gordonia sp. CPCC 205515]|uniref:hypothetical protein n=1 Tax=Gordonia sp. CPCC 205515 TaxID=3140791 RepID=UPI003AF3670E